MAVFGLKAQLTADWNIHMPFDAWPNQIMETPERVYFTARTFEYKPTISGRDIQSNALYYYDKAGDEIVSINERIQTSGNAVARIAYNYDAKYLLVVYTDCDIDFIYDDGRVFNLPALKVTTIPGKKEVNDITFYSAQGVVYIATSFGYLSLSGNKHEVIESRNYGHNIQSIGRSGDDILMCVDGKLYYAPEADKRFNLEDYKLIDEAPELDVVLPCTGYSYALKSGRGNTYIVKLKKTDGRYTVEKCIEDNNMVGVQQVSAGYRVTGNVRVYYLCNNGVTSSFGRPSDEYGRPSASINGTELWTLASQKGLRSYKVNGGSLSLSRDYMRPNSPATYIATSLYYHPTYGMLAGSNGVDLALSDFSQSTPNNISALKGGFWKEYGPNYTGSDILPQTHNYFGLAVDPKNSNHIYRANTTGGLMRVNIANPSENLIFANPSNANSSSSNFIKIADDQEAWNILCRFSTPQFTADGTLWSLHYNRDLERGELWYWPASDRLATTNAATYRPMKKINIPKFAPSNLDVMITLSKNPNIVAFGGMANGGSLMLYDHRGTPENTNDDRYILLEVPYDQDGGSVSFLSINGLYEDPSTGLVWIMSQRGLFTINPATAFEEPNRVNRIKVARNDGTNLADYLLNEINVHGMSADGEGRKWFSTSNGLVCTSADGRTILAEFTTDNSYLPSNVIYTTCYNEENNSMMVATDGGLVEMFPSGSGGSASAASGEARVYPNPVEPDFYGWVRIDNIADGSIVKITDAKGGLVKELGPAQSGAVQWDVSGLNNTRVATGVYYIMISPGGSGEGKTQVSKILVLN